MSMIEETFTVSSNNLTNDNNDVPFSHSLISDDEESLWVILLHKIQLVLTIIGFIANVVTSITLIKTGQVSMTILVNIVLFLIEMNRQRLH